MPAFYLKIRGPIFDNETRLLLKRVRLGDNLEEIKKGEYFCSDFYKPKNFFIPFIISS